MGGTRSSSNSPVPRHTNGTSMSWNGSNHSSLVNNGNSSSEERATLTKNGANARNGGGETATTTDAIEALSQRLKRFRQWLTESAGVTVHPAVCIVNGEATDGTKNAPVLVLGSNGSTSTAGPLAGRVGAIDAIDGTLYERTMGCQIRAVREIKQDEVIMTMPRSAFVTPDLVASSNAGRAILACCQAPPTQQQEQVGFWDVLENTTICEQKFQSKVVRNTGPQLLVKILQERKRAEAAFSKRVQERKQSSGVTLAPVGSISTRAPMLAFLIHQRFSNGDDPAASTSVSDFENLQDCALSIAKPAVQPTHSPESFAAYARTLPSSVSLPLCWKRNELALLAGCISGVPLLQEVATRTMQLASEFVAFLDAGILERFPETFPEGLLTWERWVWAAAVFTSRVLPVSCYLNHGDHGAASFASSDENELLSPAEVWDELGVMVPLLDMGNHEVEAHQVSWQPCVPPKEGAEEDLSDPDKAPHPPRAIVDKKVRKGSEIYLCYGNLGNQHLISQYGFAQMNNENDEVRVGWGLADAVGNIEPPKDYTVAEGEGVPNKGWVFESSDADAVNDWWSEDRLKLLEQEAFQSVGEDFMSKLKSGNKIIAIAYCDGNYHPILLTAAVVATMPSKELKKYVGNPDRKVVISKRHQRMLRSYLKYMFTRKLEKLLENLGEGVKAHFNNLRLWTKLSQGGLKYKPDESSPDASAYIGWQSFFDAHAYSGAMEVESRYYAMGSDSCVLTFFDGQLRALQASVDGVFDMETFESGVFPQLEDLGFQISTGDDANSSNRDSGANGNDKKKKRRNKKKGSNASSERPAALKLHVGNLSYSTTPSDLYDFFSKVYGTDNILECHIPIERESGRSRGFGFVTMPEGVARRALQPGQKHEFDGRLLKVAKSNSAGSGSPVKAAAASPPAASDRCATCGYRPKYCTCSVPNIPGFDSGAARSAVASYESGEYGRDYSHHASSSPGGRYRDDRYRDDRYREDPYYREYGEEMDRYGRPYDRDSSRSRRYDYDDSPSRSYGRDDRYRERGSRYDEDRSRRRSRDRSSGGRSSSRRSRDYDEGEWDRDRKRSRSRSRSRERRKSKKSKRRQRSRSRSTSEPRSGEKGP